MDYDDNCSEQVGYNLAPEGCKEKNENTKLAMRSVVEVCSCVARLKVARPY